MNITNVNITNVYRNANYRNGISAVAANDFQGGRFNNVMRTSGAQVGSAGVIRGQMPFTAGSANQRFSDRQATVVPRGNANARVFTHQQPNPVQRGQFNQGGAASRVQNAPAMTQNNRGQQNTTQNRGQNSPQSNDAGGWRRFGSPSGQPAAGQGNQPAVNRNGFGGTGQAQRNDRPSASPQVSQPSAPRGNDSRGGWQRFGTPGGGNAPDQRQSPAAPRQDYRSSPGNRPARYNAPSGGSGRQESLRIAPPVVRERPSYSAPSYNAPRQSAPSYSAPRQSAPSYSAPRQSAPAPRSNGGGGGSAPRGNSGGGGGNRGTRGR